MPYSAASRADSASSRTSKKKQMLGTHIIIISLGCGRHCGIISKYTPEQRSYWTAASSNNAPIQAQGKSPGWWWNSEHRKSLIIVIKNLCNALSLNRRFIIGTPPRHSLGHPIASNAESPLCGKQLIMKRSVYISTHPSWGTKARARGRSTTVELRIVRRKSPSGLATYKKEIQRKDNYKCVQEQENCAKS